jgi:hypothetical protein
LQADRFAVCVKQWLDHCPWLLLQYRQQRLLWQILVQFRETAAVYCENLAEHTDTLCGQNVGFRFVKARATYGPLVDPRVGLDAVEKKVFLTLLDSNSGPSALQFIASRYTDSAFPDPFIIIIIICSDRLSGLVVRVLGYRSGGPGSIPGTTRKKSIVGLERGSLSLVSTN